MSHTTTHDPYAGPSGVTCSCANCIHVSYQTLRGMERHEPIDAAIMRNRAAARFHPTTRNWVTLVDASAVALGLPNGALEVDAETAYGSTVRLSRSVRVF